MSLAFISQGTISFANNQVFNYPETVIPGATDPAKQPIVVLGGGPSAGNVNMNYWVLELIYSNSRRQWSVLVARSNIAGPSTVDFTVIGVKAV